LINGVSLVNFFVALCKSKKFKGRRLSFFMFVLAITACPTGIAHTYIAADKLKKAAK